MQQVKQKFRFQSCSQAMVNSFGNVSVFQHMNDNGILEMVITMARIFWKINFLI